MKPLLIGHSPDADDAFMFFALTKGIVSVAGYRIEHIMTDIETLNRRALEGELDVTAVSAAVYPLIAESYRIVASGASVGRDYGPILLAKKPLDLTDLRGKRIGVPGLHTTAYLLLHLYLGVPFKPIELSFDIIMDSIQKNTIDAGVIIHEGQITWQQSDLVRLLDLGTAWMRDVGLPIPLGLDVVHRRLGEETILAIACALEQSIRYAIANEESALDYAMQFGRGIDRDTCRRFVRMYVNDDTVNMGEEGREALRILYERASERGLVSAVPPLDIAGLK